MIVLRKLFRYFIDRISYWGSPLAHQNHPISLRSVALTPPRVSPDEDGDHRCYYDNPNELISSCVCFSRGVGSIASKTHFDDRIASQLENQTATPTTTAGTV